MMYYIVTIFWHLLICQVLVRMAMNIFLVFTLQTAVIVPILYMHYQTNKNNRVLDHHSSADTDYVSISTYTKPSKDETLIPYEFSDQPYDHDSVKSLTSRPQSQDRFSRYSSGLLFDSLLNS